MHNVNSDPLLESERLTLWLIGWCVWYIEKWTIHKFFYSFQTKILTHSLGITNFSKIRSSFYLHHRLIIIHLDVKLLIPIFPSLSMHILCKLICSIIDNQISNIPNDPWAQETAIKISVSILKYNYRLSAKTLPLHNFQLWVYF